MIHKTTNISMENTKIVCLGIFRPGKHLHLEKSLMFQWSIKLKSANSPPNVPRFVKRRPVAERRKKAAREVEKLRKKGYPIAPVTIEGRTIAKTFWGKAWCDNLESYRDYEYRLPRGRSYARHGSVIDLQISGSEIKAMVSGSSIYNVTITIKALEPTLWRSICDDCAGSIDSLVELLQCRLSKGVMERLCRQDKGLFPKPSEVRFSCSCLDGASMCKHVAAALYGVGARLDGMPELLFRLRDVLNEAPPAGRRNLKRMS